MLDIHGMMADVTRLGRLISFRTLRDLTHLVKCQGVGHEALKTCSSYQISSYYSLACKSHQNVLLPVANIPAPCLGREALISPGCDGRLGRWGKQFSRLKYKGQSDDVSMNEATLYT